MLLLIRPHNTYKLFYFSNNKVRFWVGDIMQSMQLTISKNPDGQPYIHIATFPKTIQNTLRKSQTFL